MYFANLPLLAAWTWGDKSDVQIPMALFYALLGILVVFAVLVILILVFTLQEKIFKYNLIDRGIAGVKNFFKKLFGKKQTTVEAAPSAADMETDETEEEVIAAVMAAVSVVMQAESEDGAPAPFVVKSIKRTHHCH